MSNNTLNEIIAIFGSDLSPKEQREKLKKYSDEEREAAIKIMLSQPTGVKDLPS